MRKEILCFSYEALKREAKRHLLSYLSFRANLHTKDGN